MSTYAEKAAAYGTPAGYATVQDGYDASADYYRQQQQYVGQAYPQGYQTQQYTTAPQYMMPQQGMYGYMQQDAQVAGRMNSFNAAAPPPNFSRPPPGKDDYQSTGLAYPSSAQSSMAYTASWGTPGVPHMVGEFGQWNNPDQGGDSGVTSGGSNPYGQVMDQFNKMSVSEQPYDNPTGAWGQIEPQPLHNTSLTNQAWPGLDQANERMNKDKKREEREKRQREEAPAKELSWEDRLKRAQGAKDRVENPRFEKRDDGMFITERGGRGRGRGGYRGGAPGRGRDGDESRDRYSNGQRRQPMQNVEGDMRGGMRGGMSGSRGALQQPGGMPQSMQQQMGMYQRLPPQGIMGAPPHYMSQMPPPMIGGHPQDQRFRNSWLDANLFGPFPMPFPPMTIQDYQMQTAALRGRGARGGRGMGRGRGGFYPHGDRDGIDGENSEERYEDEASEEGSHGHEKHDEEKQADTNPAQDTKPTQGVNVE